MAMPRNNAETVADIVKHKPTSNPKGTLSAGWLAPGGPNLRGSLPDTIGSPINYFDRDGLHDVYVVRSYDTPILWWVEAEKRWYAPKVRYSPTTSRHQRDVSWALLQTPGGYPEIVFVYGTPTHGWKLDRQDKKTLHRSLGDAVSSGKAWQR